MGDDTGGAEVESLPLDVPVTAIVRERALAKARAGADDAVGQLLEAHRPYLLAIANWQFPDDLAGKVGPSDLVQETILKGYEQFASFQGSSPEELAGWLRQILLNRLADTHTYYFRQRRDVGREEPVGAQHVRQGQPSPSEEVRQRERRALVEAALGQLPEHYRRVIRLRHDEDLSFREIASVIQNTEEGARKLWTRAVQALQKELGADRSWLEP